MQARVRLAPTTPPRPGWAMRIEHEDVRGGDGHRAVRAAGRPGDAAGGLPRRAARLLDCGQRQQPSRRGRRRALAGALPEPDPRPAPTHATWRNQIELFFSIVQRKALTLNAFPDLSAVEARLLAFEARYNDIAVPFHWRFTRQQRTARLTALADLPPPRAAPAPPPRLPTPTATVRAA